MGGWLEAIWAHTWVAKISGKSAVKCLLQCIYLTIKTGHVHRIASQHRHRLDRAAESCSPQHLAGSHIQGKQASRLKAHESRADQRRCGHDFCHLCFPSELSSSNL